MCPHAVVWVEDVISCHVLIGVDVTRPSKFGFLASGRYLPQRTPRAFNSASGRLQSLVPCMLHGCAEGQDTMLLTSESPTSEISVLERRQNPSPGVHQPTRPAAEGAGCEMKAHERQRREIACAKLDPLTGIQGSFASATRAYWKSRAQSAYGNATLGKISRCIAPLQPNPKP